MQYSTRMLGGCFLDFVVHHFIISVRLITRFLGDQLGDLANGNSLSLISERESSKLSIVLKLLYAHSRTTNQLHSGNDAFAPLCVSWWPLALTPSTLLQTVE